MILSKVYEDAERRLERNEITLGEFERLVDIEVIEPKRGEWIPCSERLPKENGRYLVTFPSLINKLWVDILWYGRPTFPETDHPCFYASDDEYGDVEYDDVVAWMPLPKPYEEREGE